MEPNKILPALILTVLLITTATIWFYPPTGDYRVDNPAWNGYMELNKQTNATTLNTLNDLPPTGKNTALILVPYTPFSNQELTQLKNYITTGGTLLLLDDYGHGNQVLNSLDLKTRFNGQTLIDPLFNYKNKYFPTITNFPTTPINLNQTSITLNHATYLTQTNDMTTLAYSSTFSFADLNLNETWDPNEPNGQLPVAAYTKHNQGYIITISDPSIAINSMLNQNDNTKFIQATLNITGTNPQTYIDQSHLPNTPLDEAKTLLTTTYQLIASPQGTLTLIIIVLALSLSRFWKKEKT
ncbi:MAG: DUF4350 domain-containing protein [Candidatus Bathyarchaeia archaeon]|jgi:hypothetical protein